MKRILVAAITMALLVTALPASLFADQEEPPPQAPQEIFVRNSLGAFDDEVVSNIPHYPGREFSGHDHMAWSWQPTNPSRAAQGVDYMSITITNTLYGSTNANYVYINEVSTILYGTMETSWVNNPNGPTVTHTLDLEEDL